MPTKRTPRHRPPKARFTPAALNAFRRMMELRDACTCAPDATEDCSACTEWNAQERILHTELRLSPWETAVQDPEVTSPYPKGTLGYEKWPEAQARWRALMEATA